MKIKLYMSALFLCMLFSCKKQDNPPPSCDKTVASIAGAYRWVKYEIESSGVFMDVTSEVDDCGWDNILIFNKDGSYFNSDVGIVCSYTEGGGVAGSWSISPTGELTINFDDPAPTDNPIFDITSFDCSTLVL